MAELLHIQVRSRKQYRPRRTTQEADYRKLYRFDDQNVQWLASYFIGENTVTRGGALGPKMQIQVLLRYISDPGFQVGVGEDLGIHQSTVSKTIKNVSYLTWNNYQLTHGPLIDIFYFLLVTFCCLQ